MSVKSIGRFEIIHELGRGVQSVVYLARDPQARRKVAIKTWYAGIACETETVLREARAVAKLQHSNIVPLYEAGERNGIPYLVYAYEEGSTLAKLLGREEKLPPVRAVQIALGVLDGLIFAHAQGVLHLDLKPSNIMIVADGTPVVMDFGTACLMAQQDVPGGISGTPQYMAPECLSGRAADCRADLFALGMTLYEMVTGAPAVEDGRLSRTSRLVAYDNMAPPSRRNLHVDTRLDAIILKALAPRPEERYADAAAMRQALQEYLEPPLAQADLAGEPGSPFETLLRRMRGSSGDFPVLSGTISEINTIVASESASSGRLTQVILQDFGLTSKLLKLVNTVSYGQYGGNIHTISKAVAILGFEAVRNISTSLILLELLQNRQQAAKLRDEIAASYLAGMVAASLVPGYGLSAEEARICAMFHNLGRMIAIYFFFDESERIVRLMQEQGLSEEQAATEVLGISYEALGTGMARVWHLPDRLVGAMQKLPDEQAMRPRGDVELMSVVAELANEICAVASLNDPQDKTKTLRQLCERYKQALVLSEKSLAAALDTGLQEMSKRAAIIGVDMAKGSLLDRVGKWSGVVRMDQPEPGGDADILLDAAASGDTSESEGVVPRSDPEAVLSSGIQDVTNTLVEDFQLNDLLLVVLETIYCSLGFRHALILVRDDVRGVMAARFGFGDSVDKIMPQFRFPLKFMPDVFHLAIDQGLDIVIEDVQAPNIAGKIPEWLRRAVDSQCFLLMPIMVNKRAVGLIYADMQEARSLQISRRQLSLLRTLRNQAVLAIKQKV